MTQLQSPQGRRVLIIEDEFLIALDLEETMFKIGFDVCALAQVPDHGGVVRGKVEPGIRPGLAAERRRTENRK